MGGEAQLTVMVLKVDLGCTKCCRKIKKVLCSTPQVRDQLFDDKSNTVTCTVICCTPEKIADKIRRKAGGTVKGIEIKPSQPQLPAKPPADKPKEGGPPPPQADKPKQGPPPPKAAPLPSPDDKPKSAPPPADKPKSAPPPAEKPKSDDKPKAAAAPPPTEKPKGGGDADKPKPQPQPQKVAPNGGEPKKTEIPVMGPPPQQQQMPMGQAPQQQQMPMGPPPQMAMKPNQPAAFMSPEFIPVAGYPSIFPPVVYYGGGPYYQNQGPAVFPQQPVYQYDGYQGRPVGDYYGGGRGDDSPTTCSVM